MPSARSTIWSTAAGAGRERGHSSRSRIVLIGQRRQAEGREPALTRAPRRAAVEELGAGQGDDVDRLPTRPGKQVLDEVEEAVIGPLEVLEDHDHGHLLGDALEEGAPRREQLAALRWIAVPDAEQVEKRLGPGCGARRRPGRTRPGCGGSSRVVPRRLPRRCPAACAPSRPAPRS